MDSPDESGLPFPTLGDLPDPGIKPWAWQAESSLLSHLGSPVSTAVCSDEIGCVQGGMAVDAQCVQT